MTNKLKIGTYIRTKKIREKNSKNRIGKCIGNANPSKRLEVRKKISKAHKGRTNYWLIGKHRTKEVKLKISKAQKGVPRFYLRGNKNPMAKKEIRLKVSNAQKGVPRFYARGNKNYFYKDGKSNEPYHRKFNKSLKEQIRQRDNKCMICNISREKCLKKFNKELFVHHINRNKKEYRPFYLICLCLSHHTQIQRFQDDLKDYFYAKNLSLI